MSHFPVLKPLTLSVLASLYALPLHAQQTNDDTNVQTVVVSASADASAAGLSKTYAGGQVAKGGRVGLLGTMDVMDTPFNSTNYTQQFIQDQQARSVADVLQADPGVRVARGFGNYQELYVIRGFPVNSDDLAYNGLNGVLPRQYIAAELLERVEVFRGANTFLNGATPGGGGIGGAINLLPKRAPNQDLTEISAGLQTGKQTYLAADIARRFGDENRYGVRVNLAQRKGGTGIDNEDREVQLGAIGADYRGRGFRLSADLGWQSVKLSNARPAVNAATVVPAAPDGASNYGQPWDYSSERDLFGTLRSELDIAKDVVAWAALGGRESHELNRLGSTITLSNASTGTIRRFDNARVDLVKTGEVGVRATLQTGPVSHKIAATANGFNMDSRNAYATSAYQTTTLYNTPALALPTLTSFFNDLTAPRTTNSVTLISEAVVDSMGFLNDTLLLTVGVRHQYIKQVGYAYNTGIQNAYYSKSANTPIAAIVYKLTPQVSLYANRVESLLQGAIAGSTAVNRGDIFAPYVSVQKEVGAKFDAGRYGATAALFTTTQPQGITDPLSKVFGIDGEQRNRGLELTAYGQPLRGVRVLGGATFLDATQMHTAGGTNDGKDVIGVPHAQMNLGVDWDIPGVRGLSMSARALHTSSQPINATNTLTLPSWNRLDASVRYGFKVQEHEVVLRARVDNLTDKSYWASAGGSQGSGYLVLGAPRTFALTATTEF
ncbi:TonB-dependent siderophore receptor [Duganella sp. FT80W]|uniref:TonB-dependent siderophore receptor n=1 Tax=Duganella guangzhouensis TaxID=2666084 RepID=A0A6I2L2K8_9BURK|nr:TonB-dependent siderophore receptor [Duganella guangzhouensis]MRW92042.1 TonB-dependent siderophore receptor [Duganella guangzhouensis]